MKIDLTSPYAAESMKAMQALLWVMDPELGINIVDMGLIYGIDFSDASAVTVEMTLSSPYCPMGESITEATKRALQQIFTDRQVTITLVWEPEWTPERISEEGKKQLEN